ncbi:hypothetical protein ACOME3_004935 [Neoechinorhynchus agilis]
MPSLALLAILLSSCALATTFFLKILKHDLQKVFKTCLQDLKWKIGRLPEFPELQFMEEEGQYKPAHSIDLKEMDFITCIYYFNPCCSSIYARGGGPYAVLWFDSDSSKGFRLPQKGYGIFVKFKIPDNLFFKYYVCKYIAHRAYKFVNSLIAENALCAYPFIEVVWNDELWFMVPLSKQLEYCVPTAKWRYE